MDSELWHELTDNCHVPNFQQPQLFNPRGNPPRAGQRASGVSVGLEPTIAIVGAGPRGLSVLERIAAHVSAGHPSVPERLEIHLIDPYPPAGRVWRLSQQDQLLMNTIAADATLYLDESVKTDGPIHDGPSLLEWAADWDRHARLGYLDAQLAEDARSLGPTSTIKRRLYGAYLWWVFDDVCARLKERNVAVHFHGSLALSVVPSSTGCEVVRLADGKTIRADSVVLALGHGDNVPDLEEAKAQRDARDGNWTYIGPSSPSETRWSDLSPGEPVIVRGLGLNFFDAMALLTVGRGGSFARQVDNSLIYQPSGREPVLWVGSRRGVPFKAKPVLEWPRVVQQRRYPSQEVLASFRRPFNFQRDGWPWVRKEALWQYYKAQIPASRVSDLEDVFDLEPGTQCPADTSLDVVFDGLEHQYSPELAGDPFKGRTFSSLEEVEQAVLAYIQEDLDEALAGASSPRKAADAAIGNSRAWLGGLMEFDSPTWESREIYERWFASYANSLAGGPPLLRIQQLLALAKAGIVRFLPPALALRTSAAGAVVTSPALEGWRMSAGAFVETRIHTPSLTLARNPLIRTLLGAGRIRPYRLKGSPEMETNGLEVEPETFRVVDAQGRVSPHVYALGIPLGTHLGTSFTAMGRSNSAFLRQTDSVARLALTDTSRQPISSPPVINSLPNSVRS
ncbi:FAD/NAD(P)-binding protein [Paenarthrobacter sp. NyZ202]|uniref:FAD/NAD(P)-binding protein n=1 Tax=Paenarthrobacter sp. NyZ202 TaxID=3402689 RepID=UPI003CEA17C5